MDNFNTNVKTIERDEADVRGAFRTIDTERALSKLRDDCQSISSDSKSPGLAKQVFDQVSSDNAKAHLPNLVIFDAQSKEIAVDPKVTDNGELSGASLHFENSRHQTIDQAIKADAKSLTQGNTDALREDLMNVWKAAGTPGVFAFVNKLNEQLDSEKSGMSLKLPSVSRGMASDIKYEQPLCHPRIVKGGQVVGDFKVY